MYIIFVFHQLTQLVDMYKYDDKTGKIYGFNKRTFKNNY